ncbi:MAG: hypothetical protein NZT92_03860 [Abditibacteriales bacterium]|nr:hypothetical protein [Abditibacteriales bacterium]MDW8365082.1 hypothetical protein [Abditibacteriales bacterium]
MDVIGLWEEEAEEIMRRQGCRVVRRAVTQPPQRQGAAGRWRVVRQRYLTAQEVEITLSPEMVAQSRCPQSES